MKEQLKIDWDGIDPRVQPESDQRRKSKVRDKRDLTLYQSLILETFKSLSVPPEAYVDLPEDRR